MCWKAQPRCGGVCQFSVVTCSPAGVADVMLRAPLPTPSVRSPDLMPDVETGIRTSTSSPASRRPLDGLGIGVPA